MTFSAASRPSKRSWAAAGRLSTRLHLFYSPSAIVTSDWASNLLENLSLSTPHPRKANGNGNERVGGSDPHFGRGVAPAHADAFGQQ